MTMVTPGTKLGIRKIKARIGAEITGLSPDLILDPDTVAAVRAALNEHKALVFRGVRLDDEDQQRFRRLLRPADLRAPHRARCRRRAERSCRSTARTAGSTTGTRTLTFVLNPPQASTLRSVIVPPYGGETLIANTGGGLPGPARTRCAPSRTRCGRCNTNDYDYAVPPESLNETPAGAPARSSSPPSTRPPTPWSRVHPLTGKTKPVHRRGSPSASWACPRASRTSSSRSCSSTSPRPENILRVTWEPGQLCAVRQTGSPSTTRWTNYERRAPSAETASTVAGDIPVGIDGSPSYSVQGDASHYTPVAAIQAAA